MPRIKLGPFSMDAFTPLNLTLAFGFPGSTEMIILLVLGLLIFGRRLPEVGRSMGRSIVEFKKGIKGIDDDIEDASDPKPIEGESPQQIPQWAVRDVRPDISQDRISEIELQIRRLSNELQRLKAPPGDNPN